MKKTIGSHMVKSPYLGRSDKSLQEAIEFMQECNIRHLPVVEQGRLAGLVSERDLRQYLSLPSSDALTIGDVMKTDLYVAQRTAALKEVVATMAEQKIGSALVVNEELECIGIFTTTDALEILADLLDEQDEEEAAVLNFSDFVDYWSVPRVAVI